MAWRAPLLPKAASAMKTHQLMHVDGSTSGEWHVHIENPYTTLHLILKPLAFKIYSNIPGPRKGHYSQQRYSRH